MLATPGRGAAGVVMAPVVSPSEALIDDRQPLLSELAHADAYPYTY
jgi:hypothetical protein